MEFDYLIDKINSIEIQKEPFEHIIIDDFLSKEHFERITKHQQILLDPQPSTRELVSDLQNKGYNVQPFPGCTTDVEEYLECFEKNEWPTDKGILEGYGLTFRLKSYEDEFIKNLIAFFQSKDFASCIAKKFNLVEDYYVDSGIQKYLHGYEISPHPDIRLKAATYMLNINTDDSSEKMNLHTYLMNFKKDRQYVQEFWEQNPDVERCWVPWDWCESKFETVKNNSITLFSPSNDTLHAVKLDYDHCELQRTQVYGNLWYKDSKVKQDIDYKGLDSDNISEHLTKIKTPKNIRNIIPTSLKAGLRKIIRKN